MGNDEAPLARHRLVDTRSPDDAREQISRIFCPHFLIPRERRPQAFHARHNCALQAAYSVNFVAYGAEVEIDPGELSQFFLLQWPLRGEAWVKCGTKSVEADAAGAASILSPTLPTRMIWREGCEKLIVLVRREALQNQLEALIGEAARSVEFDVGVAMGSPGGAMLRRHIDMLVGAADAKAPNAYQVLLRDGLTTLMLSRLRHDQAARLEAPAKAPAPQSVRRAEDFIAAHIDRPLAMAEVAAAAGANLRSLQSAFRQARGVTLSECIQTKRLERFRERLCDPSAPRSITDVAYSVGLGHLGRAAAAYRARYGETPRQTLSRRR